MSLEIFHPFEFKSVSQDIYHSKFLKAEFCEALLSACISLNAWEQNNRLPFYTDDIYIKETLPEWYDILEKALLSAIDIASYNWMAQGEEISIANLFAVRYSMSSKRDLKLHHDDSYITGSIKLNNEYEGGELFFPKQNFSNKNIEVGDLLLWPGQLTHPHGSSNLLTGEKYSITIWTKNESLENHR